MDVNNPAWYAETAVSCRNSTLPRIPCKGDLTESACFGWPQQHLAYLSSWLMDAMKVVFAMSLLVALTRDISLIILLPNAFKYGSSFSGFIRRPAVDVHMLKRFPVNTVSLRSWIACDRGDLMGRGIGQQKNDLQTTCYVSTLSKVP